MAMSAVRTCPKCGASYPLEAQFCATDGAALTSPAVPRPPVVAARPLAGLWSRFFGILLDALLFIVPIVGLVNLLVGDIAGRTLGKLVVGSRVIRIETGQAPGAWGVVRFVVRILPLYWITVPFRKDKRGIHDFAAGTMVIKHG